MAADGLYFFDTRTKKLYGSNGAMLDENFISTIHITHQVKLLKQVKQFKIIKMNANNMSDSEIKTAQLKKYKAVMLVGPQGQSTQISAGEDLESKLSNLLSLGYKYDQTKRG